MKKTLIALAAMAATASFAQSTVELYGRAEVTTEVGYKQTRTSSSTTAGVTTANAVTQNIFPVAVGVFPTAGVAVGTGKPQLTVQDGNTVGDGSSRFGLRGTEDLGGGLKAVFQMEAGINIDDGSAGNGGGNLFSRTAMVGLEGGFGRVTAGRQVNPAFGVQAAGQALGTMNNYLDGAAIVIPAAGGVRSSNSVIYTTPNFGGLTVSAMYAAAEDKGTARNGANLVSTNNKPGMSLGLNYASGPLYLGLGYDARKAANSTADANTGLVGASASAKINQWVASAAYDLGVVKPFFSYTVQKVDASALAAAVTTNAGGKEKAWTLGLTAPVGAGLVFAEYGNSKTGSMYANATAAGVTVDGLANQTMSGKETALSVGYRYSMSKRTFVQAAYGTYKQTANWSNVAGDSDVDTLKRSGLALTLSHAF
jgi:predicted porin